MSSNCYAVIPCQPSDSQSVAEIKSALEKGNAQARVAAMKQLLVMMTNGEDCSDALLMSVIRYIVPETKDKILKKLMLLFFEVCPKTNAANGELKQEMILVW